MEREWSNHAAGLRTHILVCLGSTVIMLLSMYGFGAYADVLSVRMDPARLAAQVISGVGFLGAGAILRNGSTVSGLTTAASIWVVAAIGLCIGAGFMLAAAMTTTLVLVSLFALNKLENQMMRHRRLHELHLRVLEQRAATEQVYDTLRRGGIRIVRMKLSFSKPLSGNGDDSLVCEMKLYIKVANHDSLYRAVKEIASLDSVLFVETGPLRLTAMDGKHVFFSARDGHADASYGKSSDTSG